MALSQGEREYFNEQLFYSEGKTNEKVKWRRIATQRITGVDERLRIVATIIDPEAHFADSTNSIKTDSNDLLEYVLGLMNSKLFQWRFKKTSSNNNVSTTELESMPYKYNHESSFIIIKLVKEMLKIKDNKASSDISVLQKKVDDLVYRLYELSEDEIKIIENSEK